MALNIDDFINDKGKLIQFTFPGGYPVGYLDQDDSVLCPECAEAARGNGLDWDGPVHGFVCHEGGGTDIGEDGEDWTIYCGECSKGIG
jgi:hypothetical protein